ncbi:MAG TPA: hypothetical protein VJM14_07910 [Burkholderiales bacterium]|nr:hypothetical protein [Burkholderiales bacterium]
MIDTATVAALFIFAVQAAGYPGFCRGSGACDRLPAIAVARSGEHVDTRTHGQVSPTRPDLVVITGAALARGPVWAESVLVHEFVHVLQFRSGRHDHRTCDGRADMEAEAYRAMDAYLQKKGLALRSNPVGAMRERCRRAREAGLIREPLASRDVNGEGAQTAARDGNSRQASEPATQSRQRHPHPAAERAAERSVASLDLGRTRR